MKFSFSLIKKLVPGKYTKSELADRLNSHSFETVDIGGDILEIAIPPNRYSDAASHLGIAREAAANFNLKLNDPTFKITKPDVKDRGLFTVNVKDKKLCFRYAATYVADVKVGSSPNWLKNTLESCGLRSINNVVDIMNYAMLELGQPMHAFDADKISGGLVVRGAKKGEIIETIDGNKFDLSPDILVIADGKAPQAIAGIKGGKFSEVTSKTKRILVEAANFNGANIYRSSRKLGLATDASIRFSHQLSSELVSMAMNRALGLLKELAEGKIYSPVDVYPKKQSKKILKLDLKKISNLIGHDFNKIEFLEKLSKPFEVLGFKKLGNKVEIPMLRTDISLIEDLAEEVARLYGFNNLAAKAPVVFLGVASQEDRVTLKDRIRNFLASAGLNEVYNYSFLSREEVKNFAVEIINPISGQFEYLRDSLKPALAKNLEDNSRFFDSVRIFEIGKVFYRSKTGIKEKLMLGAGIFSKESYPELKGLADSLLGMLGITDYELTEKGINTLAVHADETEVGVLELIPSLKKASVLELDLDALLKDISEEKEFKPLSKFPSITRDLSIYVPNDVRVGDILEMIQQVSSKLTEDVDLIDFYEPPAALEAKQNRNGVERRVKSLTFRIVFQADDRTLTDAEADREMAAINQVLIDKFDAELR